MLTLNKVGFSGDSINIALVFISAISIPDPATAVFTALRLKIRSGCDIWNHLDTASVEVMDMEMIVRDHPMLDITFSVIFAGRAYLK